jgi:hypothetical protein
MANKEKKILLDEIDALRKELAWLHKQLEKAHKKNK